ncbi:unnamed protein product [Chrysoparadoxa australica]
MKHGVARALPIMLPRIVVLVGDSVRSHPPDPGLGVNKALEDVLLLKIALENHPTNLAEALKAYEESNLENSIGVPELAL